VAIAGLVPVGGGLLGVVTGPRLAEATAFAGSVSQDSHFRYLSGLLLGIGLAFWAMVPRIAAHGTAFRLLAAIVVTGGLARLLALVLHGPPDAPMLFALGMELGVTPLLCLWQWRIAAPAR